MGASLPAGPRAEDRGPKTQAQLRSHRPYHSCMTELPEGERDFMMSDPRHNFCALKKEHETKSTICFDVLDLPSIKAELQR